LKVLASIAALVRPAPKYESYEVLASSLNSAGTRPRQSKRNAMGEAMRERRLRKLARATDRSLPVAARQDQSAGSGRIGATLAQFAEAEGRNLDRRNVERVPIQLPVSLLSTDGGVEIRTCTKDLSQKGTFLYLNSAVENGSPLDFVVALPEEIPFSDRRWLCCHARVIRVQKGQMRGLSGVATAIEHFGVLRQM
jgi:hypothetical protein